jgi:hypothetical protein
VLTVEEACLPEQESADKDRGALEARAERAERSLTKLQEIMGRQAQYAFARFNSLRTAYRWGRKIYEIARENAKDGVKTMEWEESGEAKDLAGFGFDAQYEDLRNVPAHGSRMFDDSDDDDDNGSQDTSGFGSRTGSNRSGASKGGYGFMKPSGSRKRKGPEPDLEAEPSQNY